MSKKQTSYWFILDPYVHVSVSKKSNEVMFYNPLTGKIREYSGSGAGPVIKLVNRMQSPKNLLVIGMSETELLHPEINRFVNDMRRCFMGDLMDSSLANGKPVQMMPFPKIHRDAGMIKKSPSRSVGEQMMEYLAEISLYINSDCSLDCGICRTAYKQFLCCTRTPTHTCTHTGNGGPVLAIPAIEELFRQLKGTPLTRVNILGGDIFKYAGLERLMDILTTVEPRIEKVIYAHYANLYGQHEKLALFPPSVTFKIPVTFPADRNRFRQVKEMLCDAGIGAEFCLIAAGEEDVSAALELIKEYNPEKYSLSPFFNGCNLLFFQQNVFVDREDLEKAKPSLKEIYARQLVNPLHFGTLTVLSNGHIFANVNVPRLGTLRSGSLHDAVYNEMSRGRSWRRTRNKAAPCKTCIFHALCPPLSNYEYALGRNNLCHIR